ncbi:MAG: hypothetical protein KDD33_06720, partial [Bdellovibrionales bacterium]|nr:hypothetical protein [Bdellovibrionales bacterium]
IGESHIYLPSIQTPEADLPSEYCKDSAFPHCLPYNTMVCMGEGCPQTPRHVLCHSERPLNQADSNNVFAALNSLSFQNRFRQEGDPVASDCNGPMLSFFSDVVDDVTVSMASNTACIPNGDLYVVAGRANLQAIYDAELDAITANGDQCNLYANYSWDTTVWTYKRHGGFAPSISFIEATYEVNAQGGHGQVDLRWKDSGDANIYCANDVFLSNSAEYEAFFPDDGFKYEMLRTNVSVADAVVTEITYNDPSESGRNRQFFLNEMSAVQNEGGAILDSTQASAINDGIQMLINRAKTLNMQSVCN